MKISLISTRYYKNANRLGNFISDLFFIYVYKKERKRSEDITKSCSVEPKDVAGVETGTVNRKVDSKLPFPFKRPRTWTEEYIVLITNKCTLKFSKKLECQEKKGGAVNGVVRCQDSDLQEWLKCFTLQFGLCEDFCFIYDRLTKI